MKKISYLLLGVMGMLAVACEETLEPSYPQENPQNPILTSGDIVLAPYGVLASTQEIALAKYDDPDNMNIEVLKLEKAEGLVSDATLVLSLEISATEDFAKYRSLPVSPKDDDPTVYIADAYAWNDLQIAVFGNSVKPQTAYYRVPVYVNIENTDYRYSSPDYYAVSGKATVTRMDPGYQLDENYYVFGPFIGGGTPATGVAMAHDERDVYDNPNFSYTFEVTEEELAVGYSIMVAPESVHISDGTKSQCYGKGSEEGTLAIDGDPITVSEAGPYMFEVNMKDLTYSLKVAPASLYAMYSSGTFDNVAQLGTEDYVTYTGMAGLLGNFSLTGQPRYTPTLYVNNPGIDVTMNAVPADADPDKFVHTYTGGLEFSSGGATAATENAIPYGGQAGLFYITADLQSLKWTRYRCNSLGITGNNPELNWGAGPDVPLKGSRTTQFMVWTGQLTVAEGELWKIRANEDWTVNFGATTSDGAYTTDGQPVELVMNGENFTAPASGTFTVTVYLKRQLVDGKMSPYYMTVTPVE